MQMRGSWLIAKAGVGPLHQPHDTRVVAYWIVTESFTMTIWYVKGCTYALIIADPSNVPGPHA
jgi:hypothetical protein